MNKEEILNTFLLANIPEIITQEEFNDVKKAIKQLLQQNQKYKEAIDKVINNSQYWIDYYTRLNSDERIALRLQENIDILKRGVKMNLEDYNEYYIQGSDHYLIPRDVFKELFDEMSNWRDESQKQKEVIFKIKMIISARIKEYQKKIDNEIDMGSQGDHFKICRYEENIKFLKDILKEVE